MLKIHLTAVEPDLAAAWQQFCGDLENVSVHQGSIFDIQCDAVVSPANSFGFMDGGIDILHSRRFGWQVQDRLQELIVREDYEPLKPTSRRFLRFVVR